MKLYSPSDIAGVLDVKVSTVRKYSIMLEKAGYEFQKNNRGQRYYADDDVITLRKLVTLKDSGMTLDESVKGVVLWHKGNESTGTDITPHQIDIYDTTGQDNNAITSDDVQELKQLLYKQSEMMQGFSEKMDMQQEQIQKQQEQLQQQQDYIDKKIKERDKLLTHSLNELLETRKQIASSEQEERKKKSFWSRLFNI